MSKIKLYHYTSRLHIGRIMQEGLSRGEVPLSPTRGATAVWFTTDADPGTNKDHGLYSIVDKREMRITVELNRIDPNLWKWTEYAGTHNIPEFWRAAMDRAGGGKAKTWWLYFGIIPPQDFVAVEQSQYEKVDMSDKAV